jgi:hypothetical protein
VQELLNEHSQNSLGVKMKKKNHKIHFGVLGIVTEAGYVEDVGVVVVVEDLAKGREGGGCHTLSWRRRKGVRDM